MKSKRSLGKGELFKGEGKSRGKPPGTPVYVGKERTQPVRISVTDYTEQHYLEKDVVGVQECYPFRDTATVTWINVIGVHDPEPLSCRKTSSTRTNVRRPKTMAVTFILS